MGEKDRWRETGQGPTETGKQTEGERGPSRKEKPTMEERLEKTQKEKKRDEVMVGCLSVAAERCKVIHKMKGISHCVTSKPICVCYVYTVIRACSQWNRKHINPHPNC